MNLLTFPLAFAACALLGADVAARAWGDRSRILTALLPIVLTARVGLVRGWRFGWSVETALSKGWTGFGVFHAAFAAIAAAAVAREPRATGLLFVAVPIAIVGAIGAAFNHDDASALRIPLFAVSVGTLVVASAGWRRRMVLKD